MGQGFWLPNHGPVLAAAVLLLAAMSSTPVGAQHSDAGSPPSTEQLLPPGNSGAPLSSQSESPGTAEPESEASREPEPEGCPWRSKKKLDLIV